MVNAISKISRRLFNIFAIEAPQWPLLLQDKYSVRYPQRSRNGRSLHDQEVSIGMSEAGRKHAGYLSVHATGSVAFFAFSSSNDFRQKDRKIVTDLDNAHDGARVGNGLPRATRILSSILER